MFRLNKNFNYKNLNNFLKNLSSSSPSSLSTLSLIRSNHLFRCFRHCHYNQLRKKNPLFNRNLNREPIRKFSDIVDDTDSDISRSKPTVAATGKKILVNWEDNETSSFHNIWLRDHCRCPNCYHQITKQRLVDTFKIPENIYPTSIELGTNGLEIKWNDNHTSFFRWSWLRRHSYDPHFFDSFVAYKHKKTLWDARIKDCPPIAQYDEVMNSDVGLRNWLKNIDEFGFCFVDGVPPKEKETEELAERICFIRESHYGKFWRSTANLAHGDTAYTTLPLKAHTDNTYFTDPSGLSLFHLVEFDGVGGESLLVDGFWAARQLKMKHRDAYDALSRIPIPTHSAGDKDILIQPTPSFHPILNIDPYTEELYQIRYNNNDRSTLDMLNSKDMEVFYDSLRKWNNILEDQKNEYWVQLLPGRALIFDNWRLLHGRSAFTGQRKLIGAYLNWDDYRSKLKTTNLPKDEIYEML